MRNFSSIIFTSFNSANGLKQYCKDFTFNMELINGQTDR